MTEILELYKKEINDWDNWIPAGGRMWYDRCTDPTANGFIVQLNYVVDSLKTYCDDFYKRIAKYTGVYQLTRKMIDNADSLYKMISEDSQLSEIVTVVEALTLEEHKELEGKYKLCDFLINQKNYLQHITSVFHTMSNPTEECFIIQKRYAFYKKLRDVLKTYVDLVETCHVFNKIETKKRKIVWKELISTVNVLGGYLVGWNISDIPTIFKPDQNVKDVMKKVFEYDLETSALTDEVIQIVTEIIKKHKEYVALIKNMKHTINSQPNFWSESKNVVIHDSSSDSPAKKEMPNVATTKNC